MDEQGFLKLSRRFFKNILWKEPRTYSRAEAWLDLIYSARFEASKEIVNNRVIEVRKGEVIASRRFLEKRWKWGSSKVINFLSFLENEGMINHRQTNGQTIIMLCNYEFYNDSQTNGFQENKPPTNHRQTTDKPPINQNKECKEREEGKENNISLSPDGDISLSGQQPIERKKLKKKREVFIPPSVEEVYQYCRENNYSINPERFVNHYEANGWMAGKNKMKDWRAAVRLWQSNQYTVNFTKPNIANHDNTEHYTKF